MSASFQREPPSCSISSSAVRPRHRAEARAFVEERGAELLHELDIDAVLESVGGVALDEWIVDRGGAQGHFPIVVPDAALPELLERAGTSLRRISQPSFFSLDFG